MRINRFLAAAGLGSRRACEEYILAGEVKINGKPCQEFSYQVAPEDEVFLKGKRVRTLPPVILLLHKPRGYVTTRDDPHAERTILELLPPQLRHLFHVGRLDKESEGLLLLTNDGALAQQLLHPSHGLEKEYEVTLNHPFSEKEVAALKKGIWIEGKMAHVVACKILSPYKIQLILHQGLKRQIRVMLGKLGFQVKRLVRTRIGPLVLRRLPAGSYRELTSREEKLLRAAPEKRFPKKGPVKPVTIAPSIAPSSAQRSQRKTVSSHSSSRVQDSRRSTKRRSSFSQSTSRTTSKTTSRAFPQSRVSTRNERSPRPIKKR